MAGNNTQNTIPTETLWTVPTNTFGVPVPRHSIEVDGKTIDIRNLRRFGGIFSAEQHIGETNERDTALHGLLTIIPDGNGHGGQFHDDHEWKDAVRKARALPVLDPEIEARKADLESFLQQKRLAAHLLRVTELNTAAQAETRLFGAFEVPELGHGEWRLGRIVGVEVATRGEDMVPGLVFQGNVARPFTLPDQSGPIYPYLQVV